MPNIEIKKDNEELMSLENELAELKEELKRIGSEKGQGRRSRDQKAEDNQRRREVKARIREIEDIIKKQPQEEPAKEDEVEKEEVVEPEKEQPEKPEEIKTEPKPTTEQAPNLNAQGQGAKEPKPEEQKEKVIIPQELGDLFAGEFKDEDKKNIINKTLEIIREKNGYDLQMKLNDKSEYLADEVKSYLIDKEASLVNIKTKKGKEFVVEFDFNKNDVSIEESERTDEFYIDEVATELIDVYHERKVAIDEKEELEKAIEKITDDKQRKTEQAKLKELKRKLFAINSKMNYLYEKSIKLGDAGLTDTKKRTIENIKDAIDNQKGKKTDIDLVRNEMRKRGGFKSEEEEPSPENQAEDEKWEEVETGFRDYMKSYIDRMEKVYKEAEKDINRKEEKEIYLDIFKNFANKSNHNLIDGYLSENNLTINEENRSKALEIQAKVFGELVDELENEPSSKSNVIIPEVVAERPEREAPRDIIEAIRTLEETDGRLHKVIANIPDKDKMLAIDYNKGERLSPEEVEIAKGVNTLQELKTVVSIDTLSAMIAKSRYMSFEEGRELRRAVLEEMAFLESAEKRALFHAEKNLNDMVARKEIEPMKMMAVNRFAGVVTRNRAIEAPTTPPVSPEEGGQRKEGVLRGFAKNLGKKFGIGKSEDEKKAEKDVKSQKSEINNLENELKQAAIKGSSEEEKKKIQEKMDLAKKKLEELEAKKKEIIKKENEQEEPASEDYSKELDFIEGAKNIDNMGNILESMFRKKMIKEEIVTEFNEKIRVGFSDGRYDDVIKDSNKEIGIIGQARISPEKKKVLVKFYEKVIEIAEGMKGGGGDAGKSKKAEPKFSRNEKPELKKERENKGTLDKYNLSDAYEIVKKMDENEIKKEWRAHPKLKIEISNKPVVMDEEVIKDYNDLVAQYAIKENKEVPFFFVEDTENKCIVKIFAGEAKSYGSAELSPLTAKAKNGEVFATWWNGENNKKNLFNGKNGKFKVGIGHTHPKGYGPIFSNVGGGDFGLDYSSEFEFRSSAIFAANPCASNISFVGSPDTGLIGAFEVKEDGVIVFNPIEVSEEDNDKNKETQEQENGELPQKLDGEAGSGEKGNEWEKPESWYEKTMKDKTPMYIQIKIPKDSKYLGIKENLDAKVEQLREWRVNDWGKEVPELKNEAKKNELLISKKGGNLIISFLKNYALDKRYTEKRTGHGWIAYQLPKEKMEKLWDNLKNNPSSAYDLIDPELLKLIGLPSNLEVVLEEEGKRLEVKKENELKESLNKMELKDLRSLYDDLLDRMDEKKTVGAEADRLSRIYKNDVKQTIDELNKENFEKIKNFKVREVKEAIESVYRDMKQKEEKAKKKEQQSASRPNVAV